MPKISMFAAALIVIGLGAWAVASTSRVAPSTSDAIDLWRLQMIISAENLPTEHYVDYTFVFN